MSLYLKEVLTEHEVEQLRVIRNDCRQFMTRNNSRISYKEQQEWFKSKSDDIRVFLCMFLAEGVISYAIGYALIKKEIDCYSISGGIVESYRDKGLGNNLFSSIIEKVPKGEVVELEVLKSNIRAYSVYKKLGFQQISDNDRVITMRLKND
jgi:ribosomal protein S18 acetylase RimI-like enzyme